MGVVTRGKSSLTKRRGSSFDSSVEVKSGSKFNNKELEKKDSHSFLVRRWENSHWRKPRNALRVSAAFKQSGLEAGSSGGVQREAITVVSAGSTATGGSEVPMLQRHVRRLASSVHETQAAARRQHIALRDDVTKVDDKLASIQSMLGMLLQAAAGEGAPEWAKGVASQVLQAHGEVADERAKLFGTPPRLASTLPATMPKPSSRTRMPGELGEGQSARFSSFSSR
jgi:hypothetical protein